MPQTLENILGADSAIARRLGERYEFRPQQLEMAAAVQDALNNNHPAMIEAGTGVGKSFAYLLPVIDWAVKNKKRVVISTHTISLQEQLIYKDIPLLQSVYPDEFTAILVKGRNNYLCQRRLEQTRRRQDSLFESDQQRESLWMIEEWAAHTTDGSLADVPKVPEPGVWDKVCAEHGNCLGKKCPHYKPCFWQAAKRRMQGGRILIVNHALFFSDLALRMAGVQYLPKYDAVVLDEAHTVEAVAGDHFGLKVSEFGIRYQLRGLYDPTKGKGLLNTHGAAANPAIQTIVELHERLDYFFQHCIEWQETFGRHNGRIHEKQIVENDVTPKLLDLHKHLKSMLADNENEEEVSELTSIADKVHTLAISLKSILDQEIEGAVYWMEIAGRTPQRVTLHAAPVCIAEGLKMHLFDRVKPVILCSATMCAGKASALRGGTGVPPVIPPSAMGGPPMISSRGTGGPPVNSPSGMGGPPMKNSQNSTPATPPLEIRQGAYLPHWTKEGAIYAVTYRLADSLPQEVLKQWLAERDEIVAVANQMKRPLSESELQRLDFLHSEKVEKFLDSGYGSCALKQEAIANLVRESLNYFDGKRYRLIAWCIMPNHVHVILEPINAVSLSTILHTWKSRTAKEANRVLKQSGTFWQPEYYDHLIRNQDDLNYQIEYAFTNPDRTEPRLNMPRWKLECAQG